MRARIFICLRVSVYACTYIIGRKGYIRAQHANMHVSEYRYAQPAMFMNPARRSVVQGNVLLEMDR